MGACWSNGFQSYTIFISCFEQDRICARIVFPLIMEQFSARHHCALLHIFVVSGARLGCFWHLGAVEKLQHFENADIVVHSFVDKSVHVVMMIPSCRLFSWRLVYM
jgi:hypothetical protein